MSVMTIGDAWPAAGPITVAELNRMPDDGRRYELLDGVLVVSPRPTPVHQFVAFRLANVLDDVCPEGLSVLPEPALEIDAKTELDPDIVVVHTDLVGTENITEPPLLVVEVRSPSTALIDLNRKKSAYEKFGVPSYWIVDPGPGQPELTAFELRDGHYALAAQTTQTVTLSRPFAVTVSPADPDQGAARVTP